ncbi:hypothetical protein [Xanthomonas medicagonis]|uniref:hypothetical protein n=1 Tax=Xanthomonas medicagonis TaxID=3160841 RepID=UPI00351280D9
MKTAPVFEIYPLQGVGPLRLGSVRADARQALSALGFPLESSHGDSDYFCDASIQLECDPHGRVWFIGISDSERFVAQFQGADVFVLSAQDLFSLVAASDHSGPHRYVDTEYCFPNQIVTLWDADAQYDRRGNASRPVWAQVGVGNASYAAAVAAIRNRE